MKDITSPAYQPATINASTPSIPNAASEYTSSTTTPASSSQNRTANTSYRKLIPTHPPLYTDYWKARSSTRALQCISFARKMSACEEGGRRRQVEYRANIKHSALITFVVNWRCFFPSPFSSIQRNAVMLLMNAEKWSYAMMCHVPAKHAPKSMEMHN